MQISSERMKLTNREVADILGSVTSLDYDSSLTGLLRAIVINHEEGINIEELKNKSQISMQRDVGDTSEIEYFMTEFTCPIVIAEVSHNFNLIDPKVKGWTTFDSSPLYLNHYWSQIVKSKVYINESLKRVVAFVDKRITHIWVQAFESMLWAVLPWYFPERTDEVISFFRKLSVGNKEVGEEEAQNILIQYVNSAAEKIDLRSNRLHKLLDGLADVTRQNNIKTQKDMIARFESDIQNYMSELECAYGELESAQTVLNGLINSPPEGDDELFNFFDQHKNISILGITSDNIRYGVDDTLEFYDESEAEKLFENKKGWAVSRFNSSDLKYLKDIFINKRGIIRISATFILNHLKLVTPKRGEHPVPDSMPNPHIFYHACSGGNDKYYSKFAKENQWDLGIEQSISATKNWSVGDTVVGEEMFRWIINSVNPFIYVTDGTPIERVVPGMRLVSYKVFKEIIDKADKEAASKESEEQNNG